MLVTIINKQSIIDLDLGIFKKLSKYLADKFDRDKNSGLNIIFVDRQKIRQLNKQYRNIDRETDVLAFAYNSDGDTGSFNDKSGLSVIGEIIISPEVAFENSKNNKKDEFCSWSLKREIVLLITHGILHIYSYDHGRRDEKSEMESIQDSLLGDAFANFNI